MGVAQALIERPFLGVENRGAGPWLDGIGEGFRIAAELVGLQVRRAGFIDDQQCAGYQ